MGMESILSSGSFSFPSVSDRGLGDRESGRGEGKDKRVGKSADSHKNPIPGLGKIFKDLDSDVTGIEAVKNTTVGERPNQMGLWAGSVWDRCEMGDAYLIP